MTIEICTNSYQSAKIAAAAGVHRIELCQSLESGGLTPSAGDIRKSVELKSTYDYEVNVLIRPRNGDFCYGPDDYEVMKEDIRFCRNVGVDGIVIGGLLSDGRVDEKGMQKLIEEAGDLSLTFHRAIDLCTDADEALKRISALGFDRVLTSGRAPTAVAGKENIKRWVEAWEGQLVIMPGSGINANNIKDLLSYTGAKEVHFSAKETIESGFDLAQELFELNYWQTSSARIEATKKSLGD